MYEKIVNRLRNCTSDTVEDCTGCPYQGGYKGTYCMNGLIEEAADAIEELSSAGSIYGKAWTFGYDAGRSENTPHWIPVTERLPENLTSVIVRRKDGGIFMWEYFNTSPTDECWIDDSMNVYSFYDVTHWMPLPQPPKEDT